MTRAATILVVDDEPDMVDIQAEILRKASYEVFEATSVAEGMRKLESHFVDLMLLDERIGAFGRGTEMMSQCRERHPGLGGILITGHADLALAVAGMRAGALDLLAKPIDKATLLEAVERALTESEVVREARYQRWASTHGESENIIGQNAQLRDALKLAMQAAPAEAPVLILGESGTGKELFARLIHARSPRRNHVFLPVNMSAIPAELRETALFGHRKGAFTGAAADRPGQFQAARGGTLFLDEIGDADLRLQSALLRAIQEKEVTRVGDTAATPVDVRIVAATNRDLEKEIAEGRFREDLYYRLAVINIALPPLRARVSDIPALANHLVEKHARQLGKVVRKIAPEAMQALQDYLWPGNVRELENVLQRAAILVRTDTITPELLALNPDAELGRLRDMLSGTYRESRDRFERAYFERLLDRTGQDKTKAAEGAGIDRTTLYDHLERLRILRVRTKE